MVPSRAVPPRGRPVSSGRVGFVAVRGARGGLRGSSRCVRGAGRRAPPGRGHRRHGTRVRRAPGRVRGAPRRGHRGDDERPLLDRSSPRSAGWTRWSRSTGWTEDALLVEEPESPSSGGARSSASVRRAAVRVGSQTMDRLTAQSRLATEPDPPAGVPCSTRWSPSGGPSTATAVRRARTDTPASSAARWARDGSPVEAAATASAWHPGSIETTLRDVLAAWRAVLGPGSSSRGTTASRPARWTGAWAGVSRTSGCGSSTTSTCAASAPIRPSSGSHTTWTRGPGGRRSRPPSRSRATSVE